MLNYQRICSVPKKIDTFLIWHPVTILVLSKKQTPQIHGWIIFRSEASQFGVYLIFGQTNADYLPSGNLNIAMDVVG